MRVSVHCGCKMDWEAAPWVDLCNYSSIPITTRRRKIGCFNHRVVTLVAVKLKDVMVGITGYSCIRQLEADALIMQADA